MQVPHCRYHANCFTGDTSLSNFFLQFSNVGNYLHGVTPLLFLARTKQCAFPQAGRRISTIKHLRPPSRSLRIQAVLGSPYWFVQTLFVQLTADAAIVRHNSSILPKSSQYRDASFVNYFFVFLQFLPKMPPCFRQYTVHDGPYLRFPSCQMPQCRKSISSRRFRQVQPAQSQPFQQE